MQVIKKDNTLQNWDAQKIADAVGKASERAMCKLSEEELNKLLEVVLEIARGTGNTITVLDLHIIVENVLQEINPNIAARYKEFRNYKREFADIISNSYKNSQSIMYRGDKENSNADSTLVATKRSLSFNFLNTELYKRFFLNVKELDTCKEGYIYIHDMSARRDTMNCCLFNVKNVLSGGFEMGSMWYNEPKSLDTAFDVIGDIVESAAAQQYGGFTVPEVDKLLEPYAQKSYATYYAEYLEISEEVLGNINGKDLHGLASNYALKKVHREFMQGFQGWEYKFNTVGSSRGDYPFISMSLGLSTSELGKMASECFLRVRELGQGNKGFERPVLFPKLIFLYDKELHGKGKPSEDLYNIGISCSSKAMYPDWLSLTGEGYVSEIYKKHNLAISPMGCRAFLSPWYEKGGMHPLDDEDTPVFVGRFNIGAISLNLPMIYMKAKQENLDFYQVLDIYLEMVRALHIRTYEYLGEMKASCNPLAYCEGGFYGGNLKPTDKIKPILKSATASFGITALNELEQLHNKSSLYEDGSFAEEVMLYINNKLATFKKEDNILYAVYGTPAESLCGKQVQQFRAKYGIIENVSDREYFSNSFHCHVSEDISPVQKQDRESRFWGLFDGGKIQHTRYNINYNTKAISTMVTRGMVQGFYMAINLALSYCNDCGCKELDMQTCAHCGSDNLTKIDRMNGYLSFSKVNGSSRLNDSKMEELKDRKSM